MSILMLPVKVTMINFGLAYNKKNPEKLAIVAFAADLAELSGKAQSHWHSLLLDDY